MLSIIIATLTLIALDAIWIGFIAKRMYIDAYGHIMKTENGQFRPRWPAVIVVYFVLILGIFCFVIPKAHGHPGLALLWGSLFGLVMYAVYNFTNFAVLKKWSLKVSIMDTLWGVLLCGLTAFITVLVSQA